MKPKGPRKRKEEGPRTNHRIRVREIRVIDEDGSQLGVMETKRALEIAKNRGLDLVEISPTAKPPVCKILDFGKYKYEQKKKAKAAKKKQTVTVVKEIQFRPRTDKHDVDYKVKNIVRFLLEGNKVKISIRFRGREMAHLEIGQKLLTQVVDKVGEMGIVEAPGKMEGRVLAMTFAPNPKAKKPVKSTLSAEQAPEEEAPVEVSE